MIPILPELPSAPGLLAATGAMPQTPMLTGAGLDFAGLLGAALPQTAPQTAPQLPVPPLLPLPEIAATGELALAAVPPSSSPPLAAPSAMPTTLPIAVPTGKNVPEPGAQLPPLPPTAMPQAVAAPVPAAAPVLPRAEPVRTRTPAADSDAALAMPEAAEPETGIDAPLPAPIAVPEAVPVSPVAIIPVGEPTAPAPAAPDPAPTSAPTLSPEPEADAAPSDPQMPDPALLVAVLMPPAATPPAAPPVAAAPLPSDARPPVRLQRAAATLPIAPDNAAMSAHVTLPLAPAEDAALLPPASAAAPSPSLTPAAVLPAPETAAPPTPAPAQALAAPPAAPATATPERIEAPRAPTPQLESTIAQVGDLREALRAARPEMTLRHAEFGFVSLRLEQAGAQDWRAVLASRDPGFVPAIQAALAERAVAAAAASADSGQFMGQNGAGQNGTSDQRYGASPNGGQGGSQPYLGQSANRDGEAAPDHRRPSTAAALAARAEEGEEASGSPARQTRGMFA